MTNLLYRPTTSLTLVRFKHRNHPGFKPKPQAIPVKYELPDSYSDKAYYPPVKPKYPPGAWPENYDTKRAWTYYDEGQKFHSLKTIQERLAVMAYMNAQQTLDEFKQIRTRFYPIFQVNSLYNCPRMLPFNQYITNTRVEMAETSEEKPVELNSSIDAATFEKIKYNLKQAILASFSRADQIESTPTKPKHPDSYKPPVIEKEKEMERIQFKTDDLIKSVFDSITSGLAGGTKNASHDHLVGAQYGANVNIRAYWKRAGFEKEKPRGAVHPDPDTIRFQYDDVAAYQIKSDNPLRPTFKLNDKESIEPKVPDYAYKPTVFKIFADHTLPMQSPGHWYGDSREFNYLTVLNTTKTASYYYNKFPNSSEVYEPYQSMALMAGHAELTAQAYYLGFSMWKDLLYPLFGQYVLTNGTQFSLASYQLNTVRLWNKATPAVNLCSISKPEKLFQLNQEKTDFESFNDNLLKKLLNTLSVKPVTNHTELVEKYTPEEYMIGGTRLRPYLSVQNLEEQLDQRHQLLATSLYELVKYDKPMSYLLLRSGSTSEGEKPKFQRLYSKYTYDFRDIVMKYYPRDYFGLQLLDRLLKRAPKQTEKFWDMKEPVYEWANVPPADINNVPRDIRLPKF